MARILLIVGGGIAAFKAAELIRLARRHGHEVTPVLTAGGAHFVTPMTLAALAESPAVRRAPSPIVITRTRPTASGRAALLERAADEADAQRIDVEAYETEQHDPKCDEPGATRRAEPRI